MKTNIIKSLGIFMLTLLALSACRNEDNRIDCTCFDEVKNQGELRVDCGGPNCPECPPSCDDGIQNQGEQSPVSAQNPNVLGIDCGGDECEPCATCNDGVQNSHWVRDLNLTEADLDSPIVAQDINGNLYRLVSETGIDCGFPCPNVCFPSCEDGIQNGDETGVDCGGTCPNICPTPNCQDGIQNGTETGIDCGNEICGDCPPPTCSDGIQNMHIELTDDLPEGYIVVIETGIDCDNNPFTMCPDCPIPTCFDGVQNGSETGIDCGGSCITACDETVSCNNGIMDGDEAGIDCDFDDTTDCPPCAVCGDGFLNGPEYETDCVDYPIAEYPCFVCPSCHDGVLNSIYNVDDETGMLELDIDCGAPDCEVCLQELTVDDIGADGNLSPFRDQYSYNKIQAEFGNTDTLGLGTAYPGLKKDIVPPPPGSTVPHLRIIAHQGIQTANSGIYMRRIELHIPMPQSIAPSNPYDGDETVDMEDSEASFPGSCEPAFTGQDIPYFMYREWLVDNPGTIDRCFYSYVDGSENSKLSINYLLGYIQTQYYTKGGINQGSLKFEPVIGDDVEGEFDNLQFKVQYPGI